jgi:hypothetical protein
VTNTRKTKDKLIKSVLISDADALKKPRKYMKMAKESSLEDSVLK